MKRLLIFVALAAMAAGVMCLPAGVIVETPGKIVLDENRYAERIDSATGRLVTTQVETIERDELLAQKERHEREIVRLQGEIAEIDKLLTVFE